MIVVMVEVRVGEGAVEAVKDAIATMETESRKEPGCQTYAFSVDINDPTMMRIIERWESEEALKAHFGMPHMAAFGAAIGSIDVKSMEVQAFELGAPVAMPV